jgi:hypothetical protein
MRIEFTVNGRPPKKHGEKSMWDRDDESFVLAKLRERALEARLRAGLHDCFDGFVLLELSVYVPRSKITAVGDLDNFVTGICDVLQAADSKITHFHPVFLETQNRAVDPRKAILIKNDSKVLSITARKLALNEGEDVYYKVAVEPVKLDHQDQ